MDERPGLYVHLEVGMSWPRHTTTRRSISYTSGAMRDRQQQALARPPHARALVLPPAGDQQSRADQGYLHHVYNYASQSNYMANQPYWQQRHASAPAHDAASHRPVSVSGEPSAYAQAYHPQAPQAVHRHAHSRAEQLPRRSRSMSSHNSRGSAGPLPIHDRPWDADPEPMTSTALPAKPSKGRPPPQVWKPLPATPNQFRLGDDALPWSAWPDPAAFSAAEASARGEAEKSGRASIPSNISPRRNADDRERGQTVEMQSLATALMTVDNGFEDQWWYQGSRYVTMAGDLISPAALQDVYEHGGPVAFDHENVSFGSIPVSVASPVHHFQASTPTSTIVDLVSPISDFSGSPSRAGSLQQA